MQMCVHCKMYVGTSLTAMEIWTSKHDVDISTCVCLYTCIYLYESLDIYTYETCETHRANTCEHVLPSPYADIFSNWTTDQELYYTNVFSDLCYRMGCTAVCHKPSLDPICRIFKVFFQKNRRNKTGAFGNSWKKSQICKVSPDLGITGFSI